MAQKIDLFFGGEHLEVVYDIPTWQQHQTLTPEVLLRVKNPITLFDSSHNFL